MIKYRLSSLKESLLVDRVMAVALIVGVLGFFFSLYYSLWNHNFGLATTLILIYLIVNAYTKRKLGRKNQSISMGGFLLLALAITTHSWVFIIGVLIVNVILSSRKK